MIIYENTLGGFINNCSSGVIASMVDSYIKKIGYGSSASEYNSWQHSLPEIAQVLSDPSIDKDIDVAIEYKLPLTKNRIDFILYGNDEYGKGNMVIIELKQWSSQVKDANKMFYIRTLGGGSFGLEKDYLHPSYQSYSYKAILENFNEYIQDKNVGIESCSYLHNLDKINEIVLDNQEKYPFVKYSPVFYHGEKAKLAEFVKKYVKHGNRRLLYEIENSKIRPSKDFAKMMDDALKGNTMFTLDSNQIEAVATIVSQTLNAIENVKRKTIIIKGGPGCGKSVVALNALGQLLNRKNGKPINACYTTPNFTPGEAFSEDLIDKNYKRVAIKNLIKKVASFSRADEMDFDCVIVDEGHRAFTWRFGQGVRKEVDMIDRIFYASRVNVFFIDEDQTIAKDDALTIEGIKKYAKKYNSEVIENKDLVLTSQFRCLGGDDYIEFINSLLGYTHNRIKFKKTNRYDFRIFDKASDMWNEIHLKQEKYKRSRLLAGYTHEWVSQNDDKKDDFILDNGTFKMKWNLNGCPVAYINDPDQWNRIGCIHTIQGVDMEYAGVIIGKDIRYENGNIIFDKTQNAKSDARSGIRTASDNEAQKRIRNTYKVLLTRAIYGTYIYCEDKALNEYIKSLIID